MKFAIGVSYCGAGMEGWQSQPSGNTVQDHLSRALSEISGEPIAVTGAGRTDAGVHASAQVAHFETSVERPESAWVRGANALLPDGIAVQWATPVAGDFHARYSALSRTYRYVLYNHPVRPALLAGRTGWFHLPLDLERMRKAVDRLIGEHDFSSFRSAECQAKTPVRVMQSAGIRASGAYFLFDFTANAFLHHMVRNIIGCLVYVGKGNQPPQWISELIAAQDLRHYARGRCAGRRCARRRRNRADLLSSQPALRDPRSGTGDRDERAALCRDRRCVRQPRARRCRARDRRVRRSASAVPRRRATRVLLEFLPSVRQSRAHSARAGFAKIPLALRCCRRVDARRFPRGSLGWNGRLVRLESRAGAHGEADHPFGRAARSTPEILVE